MAKINLYNCDCMDFMKSMDDNSVDCILTDPPYKYLKNQKLEVDFDEEIFFNECKRILKNGGFILLFGRGTSFYRWNTVLADLGFRFKEEIVWNKRYSSSPMLPIQRVHETISIHSKGGAKINKTKIPYVQARRFDIDNVINDINRLKTAFNNTKAFDNIKEYLKTGVRKDFEIKRKASKFKTTMGTDRLGSRAVSPIVSMQEGLNVKSIISSLRDHRTAIHPTQKPVELIEILLKLCSIKDNVILDPFAGSCSVGMASYNLGRNFIGCEIDKEYFEAAKKRLENHTAQGKFDFD